MYSGIPFLTHLLHGIDLGTVEVTKGDDKNFDLPPLEEDPP